MRENYIVLVAEYDITFIERFATRKEADAFIGACANLGILARVIN